MDLKTIRLDHFLSEYGGVSRRKASLLIRQQSVMVNGKKTQIPAHKVKLATDRVMWKGRLLKPIQKKYYIAFNKPVKVLTTMNDPKSRPSVSDFFKKFLTGSQRIFPIGRLDWHSEGLLLLTNDGEFSARLLRAKVPKTYLVKLNGEPTQDRLLRLKKGVYTELGRMKALYIQFCGVKSASSARRPRVARLSSQKKSGPIKGASGRQRRASSWVRVVIAEGKNKQLHRMFEKIGFRIKVLRREAIGKLKLKKLKPGEYYFLSDKDRNKAFSAPSFISKEHVEL